MSSCDSRAYTGSVSIGNCPPNNAADKAIAANKQAFLSADFLFFFIVLFLFDISHLYNLYKSVIFIFLYFYFSYDDFYNCYDSSLTAVL